jgi:hypothetical protein
VYWNNKLEEVGYLLFLRRKERKNAKLEAVYSERLTIKKE